jgi:hypothetical protein
VQNNLIVGFSSGLYDGGVAKAVTSVDGYLCARAGAKGPATAAGTLTVASIAAIGFVAYSSANLLTSDFHLSGTTPASITTGGKNTSLSTCGLAVPVCGASTGADTCGAVTTDLESLTRSVPYSLGAYEY